MSSYKFSPYLQYFRLGETAYRDKVRFYEENIDSLELLSFHDKIEVDIDYLLCVFEVGRYEKFLAQVDRVIETIIEQNIHSFKGENIFNELIFRKAACLFQMHKYHECKVILAQLIRMDKGNQLYAGLYNICNRKIHNDTIVTIKALAMASILIVAGITIAGILLIEPFFEPYLSPFRVLRNVLLGFSIFCMVGLELGFQIRMYRETGLFSVQVMNRIFGL